MKSLCPFHGWFLLILRGGVIHLLGFYSQSLERVTRSLCLWVGPHCLIWGIRAVCTYIFHFSHLENFLWSFDLFESLSVQFCFAIYDQVLSAAAATSTLKIFWPKIAGKLVPRPAQNVFGANRTHRDPPPPPHKGVSRPVSTLASRKNNIK